MLNGPVDSGFITKTGSPAMDCKDRNSRASLMCDRVNLSQEWDDKRDTISFAAVCFEQGDQNEYESEKSNGGCQNDTDHQSNEHAAYDSASDSEHDNPNAAGNAINGIGDQKVKILFAMKVDELRFTSF